MDQHKNKIMNLTQFSDEYPYIYQHTPLGFITFYKRKDLELTKDEWIELMDFFRELDILELLDLHKNVINSNF